MSLRKVERRLFHGIMWGGLALFLAAVGWGAWRGPTRGGLGLFVLLAVVLWAVAYAGILLGSRRLEEGVLDPLEVPVFHSLFTVFGYAFLGAGFHFDVYVEGAIRDPRSVAWGLGLPLVGLAGMWLGYGGAFHVGTTRLRGPASRLRDRIRDRVSLREPALWEVLAVLAAVWALRILEVTVLASAGPILGVEFVQYHQILTVLSRAAFVPLAVLALNAAVGRWPVWPVGLAVAGEVVNHLLHGFAKPLLWLILLLYGARLYGEERTGSSPNRRLGLAGGLSAAFLFLLPVERAFRQHPDHQPGDPAAFLPEFQGLWNAFLSTWGSGRPGLLSAVNARIVERQAGVAQVWAVILEKTPSEIPYWGAEQLLSIPLLLVPRLLWPAKPVLNHGVYFQVAYLGGERMGSAAYTLYGGLYLHAGWVAVLLGMAVLGVLVAVLYRVLFEGLRRPGTPGTLALYVAVAAWMMDVEHDFVGMMLGTAHNVAVFGAVFALLFLRPGGGWYRWIPAGLPSSTGGADEESPDPHPSASSESG